MNSPDLLKIIIAICCCMHTLALPAMPPGELLKGVYDRNDRLRGHPRQVTETNYSNFNYADSHDTIPTQWLSTAISYYDRKARLTKQESLTRSGQLETRDVYHYHKTATVVHTYSRLSDATGWKFGRKTLQYDSAHRLLSERTVHYNMDSKRIFNVELYKFYYNEKGLCKYLERYRADTILIGNVYYTWDERGNDIVDSINSQGVKKIISKYDTLNRCISMVKYVSDTLQSTITLAYDSMDNLTSLSYYKASGELYPHLSADISFIYDAHGNWLSQTFYQEPSTLWETRKISYYRTRRDP